MENVQNLRENIDLDVNMIPDTMLVAHADSGTIVDVNDSARRMFKCDRETLIGKSQWELHPEDEKDLYMEAFNRGTQGERVNRLKNGEPIYIKTIDGDLIPVSINVNVVEARGEKYVIGVFRDIQEQIDRENNLISTKNRLNTLLDTLPVPVSIVDSEGYVTLWNKQATRTFGYDADSVVSKKYALFTDDKEFESLLSKSLEGESIEGHRTTLRSKNGERESQLISIQIQYMKMEI